MSVTLLAILFMHYPPPPIMSFLQFSLFCSVSKEADPDNYTHGLPKPLHSSEQGLEDTDEHKGTKVRVLPPTSNSIPSLAWTLWWYLQLSTLQFLLCIHFCCVSTVILLSRLYFPPLSWGYHCCQWKWGLSWVTKKAFQGPTYRRIRCSEKIYCRSTSIKASLRKFCAIGSVQCSPHSDSLVYVSSRDPAGTALPSPAHA